MEVKHLDEESFAQAVSASKKPVLIDFYAPWCAPCREFAPQLEKIAEEQHGKVQVAKVNVDFESTLVKKLSIRAIPTMVLFKDGKEVNRFVGTVPTKDVTAALEQI